MAQDNFFREKALAKLSSPEQLDQMIIVTDRKGWIGLIAIGLILISMLMWSFAGTIPVAINGNGILLPNGGIHKFVCMTSGIVKEVKVNVDDIVEKDQLIATIYNPELEYELQFARKQLEKLKEDKSDKNLQPIKDMEVNVKKLEGQLNLYSQIKSQEKGVITSIMTQRDDYVKEGTVVATLDNSEEPLEALLFISDENAKKIQIGMPVQISPSVIKKEQGGAIRGHVTYVSHYPTTRQRLVSLLENEQMANYFMPEGTVLLILRVELEKDPMTKSGYKWSSGKGPNFKITSGTLCSASIIIKQIHPISVVFPYTD